MKSFVVFLFSYLIELTVLGFCIRGSYIQFYSNEVSPKEFTVNFGLLILFISILLQTMKNERIHATKKEIENV